MAAHRSPASDSFTTIDDLPEEILLKIFEKLSCRSAVACTVTSRRWKTLISNPQFSHPLQRNHHQDTATLFFHHRKSGSGRIHLQSRSSDPILESWGNNGYELLSFLPCYKTLNNEPPVLVEACFNDLLVCRSRVVSPRVYYICNPFNRQWMELPPAREFQEEPHVGLFCHPYSCDEEEKGFITDTRYTYKVILVSDISTGDGVNVAIFCSKRGKWSLTKVFKPRICPCNCNGIVLRNKGLVHWFDGNHRVVSFNLIKKNPEKVEFIDLPSHDSLDFKCLGLYRGRLRVSEVTPWKIKGGESMSLKVWELMDHPEGTRKWRLVHETRKIGLVVQEFLVEHGVNVGGLVVDSVMVVGFDPCKESVIYLVYSSLVLLSYDFKTGIFNIVYEDSCGEEILDGLFPRDFFVLSHP